MDSIDSSLSPGLLRLVNQSRDKGASSWLNAMPLADKGITLNKQEFRDSLRLHMTICNNVEIEPRLQPLDNERFHLRSAVTSSEARLDIKAGGFWARGVTAFFDVRVTHVNSKCYQSKPTSEVFKEQEEEKKRKYQQRVLDVEMGSFTPLVFGTNGGMGNECQRFLMHLADKIAQKDTEPYHVVITWLRTQISFELLRSVHACVRGSRTPFRSKIEQSLDCKINVAIIIIQRYFVLVSTVELRTLYIQELPYMNTFCECILTYVRTFPLLYWKIFAEADSSDITTLAELGQAAHPNEEIVAAIEKFVCLPYQPRTKLMTVKDLRWRLFKKK
ncbi:unnamed protein product [Porites lobata]|uniref:Uncharacterized protein n=1 Tax=Porites lobata TaxID=104759 RepID=A0ABN8QPJ1_9CNID|nr:unnamed protein product [Porites lobata]